MRALAAKLVLLAAVNAALFAALVPAAETAHRLLADPEATNEVLPAVPVGADVDLVVLGDSQGWDLTRCGNQARVERALGLRMVNLSKIGGGVVPAKLLLSYFYARGNRARRVLFYAPEFVYYNKASNEEDPFLDNEPLRLGVLRLLLGEGADRHVIHSYLRCKLLPGFVLNRGDPSPRNDRRVTRLVQLQIQASIASEYPEGRRPEYFSRYAALSDELVGLAHRHGSEFTYLAPPTLLQWTGERVWLDYMRSASARDGAGFVDARHAVADPALYEDPLHLNTAGVVRFTEEVLKPLLARAAPAPPRE